MLDGGPAQPCASPWPLGSIGSGPHTFSVTATDAAGNTGRSATRTWTVDGVAPVVTITAGPPALTSAASASVSFTVDDPTATLECSNDGGPWQPCTSPVTRSALSDGSHTVAVRATDAAGNVSAPAARTWTVDAVAPGGDHHRWDHRNSRRHQAPPPSPWTTPPPTRMPGRRRALGRVRNAGLVRRAGPRPARRRGLGHRSGRQRRPRRHPGVHRGHGGPPGDDHGRSHRDRRRHRRRRNHLHGRRPGRQRRAVGRRCLGRTAHRGHPRPRIRRATSRTRSRPPGRWTRPRPRSRSCPVAAGITTVRDVTFGFTVDDLGSAGGVPPGPGRLAAAHLAPHGERPGRRAVQLRRPVQPTPPATARRRVGRSSSTPPRPWSPLPGTRRVYHGGRRDPDLHRGRPGRGRGAPTGVAAWAPCAAPVALTGLAEGPTSSRSGPPTSTAT